LLHWTDTNLNAIHLTVFLAQTSYGHEALSFILRKENDVYSCVFDSKVLRTFRLTENKLQGDG